MANVPLQNPAATPSTIRRFRTNPVEWAVFAVVSLIFCNSVYNLFYGQQGFQPNALTAMAANPTTEGRAPASVGQTFVNLEVRCGNTPEQITSALKTRIIGPLCGMSGEDDAGKLTETSIVNGANKFNATVFTDLGAGKFSTDYIPLNLGPNPIHIEFKYRDGRLVSQDFQIVKQ